MTDQNNPATLPIRAAIVPVTPLQQNCSLLYIPKIPKTAILTVPSQRSADDL